MPLGEQLLPLLKNVPGLQFETVPSCGSTNSVLLERARGGDIRPRLLMAEEQTQGRGRQGRPWQSSAGASLTFSLALPLKPQDWLGLSLAAGVALADALDPAGHHITLKWPNDLWLHGRKLGGILIETVAAAHTRVCVVGVGINILPQSFEGLATGYAALQEIDPQVTAASACAAVAGSLVLVLQRFEAEGFAPFAARFAERDMLRGQTITTTLATLPQGVAEGVDAQGALLVRAGALHRLTSGEVSVRPASAPTLA